MFVIFCCFLIVSLCRGDILVKADEKEQIVSADLNMDRVNEIRQQIPISIQKRSDLYEVRVSKE